MSGAMVTNDDVEQALTEFGLRDQGSRFAEILRESLRRVVGVRPPAMPSAALAEHELAELREIGLDPAANVGAFVRAAERSTATMAAILASAHSVADVAHDLGVSAGRVRQMLNDHTLYGIKNGATWLVPSIQFESDALVPNLGTVVAAVPRSLHPLAFFNWFTTPSPALAIEGRPLSPRDWLLTGGDPDPVATDAAAL